MSRAHHGRAGCEKGQARLKSAKPIVVGSRCLRAASRPSHDTFDAARGPPKQIPMLQTVRLLLCSTDPGARRSHTQTPSKGLPESRVKSAFSWQSIKRSGKKVDVYVYIYIYICIYVHMCIYIYIYIQGIDTHLFLAHIHAHMVVGTFRSHGTLG